MLVVPGTMTREPGHVPRQQRIAVNQEALLVRADGSTSKVTVTDVSSGGFRLAVTVCPTIGEHVFLRVERYGDFPAQIRWAIGGAAGGVFLVPVELP
jgi:hypothetical protein